MTPHVKQILWKSILSSLAGLPISLVLNGSLLKWMAWVANTFGPVEGACLIAIPFTIASILRIFVIDYVDQKYNVKLDPVFNINRLVNILKRSI